MLKITGYDHCLLGLAESASGVFVLAYSTEMILDSLVLEHEWTYDEAQEYFEAHFLDIPGDRQSPIFVTQMDMSLVEDMVIVANKAIK